MKTLIMAAVAAAGFGTGAFACPNYNMAPGESYNASGTQLRQRKGFSVVAGGDTHVGNCPNVRPRTDFGAGYFPAAPDFSFNLSNMSGLRLVVSVVSECDSALLINTASANWYYDDDDNGNLDAKIVLTRPANGRIDVWIGTYDGEYCNARLDLETFSR